VVDIPKILNKILTSFIFLASSKATERVSSSTFLRLIFSLTAFSKIFFVLFFVLMVTVSKK
jgi:hypothetical protein